MPTYQYRCSACGHEFEEFQSIMDEALSYCPECEGKVQRLISGGAGLIFKGSGFYITDYKNASSGYSEAAKKDKDASKPSSSSDSSSKSSNSSSSSSGSSSKSSSSDKSSKK